MLNLFHFKSILNNLVSCVKLIISVMPITLFNLHHKLNENDSKWYKVENEANIDCSQQLVEYSSKLVEQSSVLELNVEGPVDDLWRVVHDSLKFA